MLQCNDSTSTIGDIRVKIERDEATGKNLFTGYGEGYVAVNGTRYTSSLVVSSERLIADWPAASIEALSADHLAAILELEPEVLLVGTGARFAFPNPAALAPIYQAGIGVEVMDTPAACRTYNILLGEGRDVVAALVL
jgi:uncharacterized protein